MLGLAVFVLLISAFVLVNALTDRGMVERRRNKPNYGWFLEEMAEFEQAGGRVQEIDDQAVTVRRMMRKIVVGPGVFALLLTVGMTWFGLTLWIPAALIGLYVVAAGTFSWLVSDLFGLVDGRGPRSRTEIAVALLTLGLKGAMVAVGIFTAGQGIAHVNTGDLFSGIPLMALAIGLLTYCYLPVAIIDRHLQKVKEFDFARTTKTDAVLFLRSFGDDDLRLYSPYGSIGPRYRFIPGRKRFEEVLSSALIGRSELVGVGKPGEKLPMLGASRTYWDHDNWKDAIRSTASRTDGLLVLAGKTPSLGWEMTQLLELGLLGKTLVLFPPDNVVDTIERYAYIDEALKFRSQHKLPDELKLMLTAVAFDQAGRPIHYISGGRDWSSYIAALLHFQMVLAGDLQFDAEGAVSEAVAMAEDPFQQAAYLMDIGERTKAQSILNQTELDSSDASGIIGRAWERVALYGDLAGARQVLLASPVGAHEPMVERALAALDAVEKGGDSRIILRARYATRFQNRPGRVRVGTVQLNRIAAVRFQRLMQRIGSAEDAQDRDAACNYSGDLLDFAESEGISTLIAMAQIQLGDAEFERGNLERATALFQEAKALREAPRVQLSLMLPRLDPTKTVDEALNWLVRVADHEDNVDKRKAALRELLMFRSEYGAPEDAAWAAEQLGRSHGESGDLDTARRYFDQAHSEYTKVGRLSQAGWIKVLQAKVESQQDNPDGALKLLQQATEVSAAADDPALRFETNRLAGDIQQKLAAKTSDEDLVWQARASYESALEAAREAAQIVAKQKSSTLDEFHESRLNLSIALNDLGTFTNKTDARGAQAHYQEAVAIRRALVAEAPKDYGIARRLGFSLLYLAENSRSLQDAEGPDTWVEVVTQFSSLTENLNNSKTAASDFSFSIERFLEGQATNTSRSKELDALASTVPTIQKALRLIVEHASPDDAYKATRAIFGLATEFDRVSMSAPAHDLFVATHAARRRLSDDYPGNRLVRRGLAFSLLNANSRYLPAEPDSALSDFREATSIFENLAESAYSEASTSAQSDLLYGLMHATNHLRQVSHPAAQEFAGRAAEVARHLLAVEPSEPRWKNDLAWALKWSADAIPKEDTVTALLGYRKVLDLDVADGFPALVHWLALKNSGVIVDDIDPVEASRFYAEAVYFAKAQLEGHPSDEDWEWQLGRSLAWNAEASSSIEPASALAKWRECIELQKRRLPNHQGDLKEIRLLAVALNNAGVLVGSEDVETAAALHQEADRYFRELIALDPGNPTRLRDVVEVGMDLAKLLSAANPTHREAATAWEQVRQDIELLATRTELTQQEVEILQKPGALGSGPS